MTTHPDDDDNVEILTGDPRRGRRRGRRRRPDRPGRAARQGDADRHDDQAAARRGARGTAGRRQPQQAGHDIHRSSIRELEDGLAPELREELERLTLPFTDDAVPSDAELRIAQAQLVGWLEGLFHGIQTALFAQQMAARAQLEQMRQGRCRPGAVPGQRGPGHPGTGQYL